MKTITPIKLILLASFILSFFYNYAFFNNILKVYEFSGMNIIYLCSIAIVLFLLNVFLLSLFSNKYIIKPTFIIIFIISSFSSYFMNEYNIIIDTSMITNIFETNLDESLDLFSFKLVIYFIILGLAPSFYIYKVNLQYQSLKKESLKRVSLIILSIIFIVLNIFSFSKFYTTFFREHKPLRYSANPAYWIYSIENYFNKILHPKSSILKIVGEDAKVVEEKDKQKELIIMVVGEAARADRFSLNGYNKQTNPLLEKEDIINFSNMYSCGTATAISVPCMFSMYEQADYDYNKGESTENILDVLKKTNDVDILWRDNNSDSKGVALRVQYQNYKTSKNNPICDGECRDIGMLDGLDKYIASHKDKDIFIVLHQMGNHGPAYYKRYPKEFEKFTPVCKTNQLEKCTKEELDNAYDNAIAYTDYFLSNVINFLKPYSKSYETAMIYMSDHGESLGEDGLYLHGMPYMIAPRAQKHIPAFIWLGDGKMKQEFDLNKIDTIKDKKFSQDNLFSTLLGLFEVKTNLYNSSMDILYEPRNK